MRNNTSREYLLKKWQEYYFAAYEARLYLDTHPESKTALKYFNKFNRLAYAASTELQEKYGMVNGNLDTENPSWSWVDMPWPWTEEVK